MGVLDSSETLQLMVMGKYSDATRSFLVNLTATQEKCLGVTVV